MRVEGNIRVWATEVEGNTLAQAHRTAALPILAGPVALMPDAHLGIGATVGSVVVTDGALIPSAVGVDLGCGMVAVETDIQAADLPSNLGSFMDEVRVAVPAGVGVGTDVDSGLRRRAEQWLGSAVNRHPRGLAPDDLVTAAKQLGTLGSGNHFAEVCVDEREVVWLVLHSGSRGIGNQLASRHIRALRDLEHTFGGDPDLAWVTQGTPEFDAYVADMLWAQDYARANRGIMVDALTHRFLGFVGAGRVVQTINCHHNFAAREEHGGRNVWVTRKGAIRAQLGDLGIIPGSMGTRSYIVQGKGNADAYNSSPHGAGRRMSRGEARRGLSVGEFRDQMAGRVWQDRDAEALLDEAPSAYKDIDVVMADSQDLVTVLHELRAVLNYKGVDSARRGK